MNFIKKNGKGILLCLIISVICWFLGKQFPIIGGPVFAIIAGMILTLLMKDKAVTVKLTRTLAIIPITLVLAFIRTKKESGNGAEKVSLKQVFPFFILFFIGASVITTIATSLGVPASFFTPLKELSKFFIIMAMAAIGLNTNIVKLVKTGGKPIIMGLCCWIGITAVSLGLQHILHIW